MHFICQITDEPQQRSRIINTIFYIQQPTIEVKLQTNIYQSLRYCPPGIFISKYLLTQLDSVIKFSYKRSQNFHIVFVCQINPTRGRNRYKIMAEVDKNIDVLPTIEGIPVTIPATVDVPLKKIVTKRSIMFTIITGREDIRLSCRDKRASSEPFPSCVSSSVENPSRLHDNRTSDENNSLDSSGRHGNHFVRF